MSSRPPFCLLLYISTYICICTSIGSMSTAVSCPSSSLLPPRFTFSYSSVTYWFMFFCLFFSPCFTVSYSPPTYWFIVFCFLLCPCFTVSYSTVTYWLMVFCFLLRPSFTVSYSPVTYWFMVFCFLFWIFSRWFSIHVSLCFLVLLFGPYSEEVNWYRGVSSGGRGGQGGRGRLPAA